MMSPTRSAAAFGLACLAGGGALLSGCERKGDERYTGYAEADLVYVSAPVGGTVRQLAVTRGARVARDAELFVLDADPEIYTRAETAARVEQAQAQLTNLRKSKRPDEIAAIQQQLVQARAAAAASSSRLQRNRELVAKGFVSASVLDELIALAAQDAGRVLEIEANLALARSSAARPDEIAAADAAAAAARAEADLATWREGQARQRAPAAGLVYDVLYRAGERVVANAPVMVLLPDGALKLRFYVPQPRLAQVRVGSTVAVTCDGCPSNLRATVSFVSPQAEYTPPVIYSNENRQKLVFLVEARPDAEAAQALKPGQPIDVRLVAAQ